MCLEDIELGRSYSIDTTELISTAINQDFTIPADNSIVGVIVSNASAGSVTIRQQSATNAGQTLAVSSSSFSPSILLEIRYYGKIINNGLIVRLSDAAASATLTILRLPQELSAIREMLKWTKGA